MRRRGLSHNPWSGRKRKEKAINPMTRGKIILFIFAPQKLVLRELTDRTIHCNGHGPYGRYTERKTDAYRLEGKVD